MKNPLLKVGDLILLLKANNGAPKNWEGKVCEVTYGTTRSNSWNIRLANSPTQTQYTIYKTGFADEWCYADRKTRAKYCRVTIEKLKKEIKELEKEADNLERFEDDAAEVAHKLYKLSKLDNEEKIAEYLRVLKKTDFI